MFKNLGINQPPICDPYTLSIENFSCEKALINKIKHTIPDINGPLLYKQLYDENQSYIVFSKKSEALHYMSYYNWDNRLKLFSEDYGRNGAKKFILSTKEYIFDLVNSRYAHLYENIEKNQRVKLHIDLDYKTKEHNLFKLNKLFGRLTNETIELINKELSSTFDINNPQIIILKSNQVINKHIENKISGHIIYNDVVFEDIYQMKTFFLSLKSDLINQKIIDKNIYRVGCFRMLECSKKFKNNKLKFFKGINYQKPDSDTLFYDSLVTEMTCDNYHLVPVKNEIIKTAIINEINHKLKSYSNKNPIDKKNNDYIYHFTDCEYNKMVKFIKKIPASACDDYLEWILITFAFSDIYHNIENVTYRNKIYELWNNWCKNSEKYNEEKNKKYFNTLMLDYKDVNHIPLVCNSKYRFKKYIKYDAIKPKLDKFKKVCANEKFINRKILLELIKENDIIFIKSPTGTGKTSLLEELFDIKKDDNNKPLQISRSNFKKAIVSITPRKNLAIKHAKELLLDAYNDKIIYLFDCVRLAVTANSLIHVEENNFRNGYVVLDEVSQLLRYYKSRIMDGRRSEAYKLLGKIVRNAEKIIVLDADLTANNIETILSMKGNDNYLLYYNSFQNRLNINANFYDNEHVVAQMLVDDFKNKRPFVASFDSLTMMEALLSEMKQKTQNVEDAAIYDKLLKIYSSKHGDDEIDTDEWHGMCIMFTPLIIYSLDFNAKEPVRSYAFVFKNILTAVDINQQIQRNRNQSDVHIYVSTKVGHLRYPTEESFKLETKERINKYNDIIKELEEMNKRSVKFDALDDAEDKFNDEMIVSFNKMYINTGYLEETMKVNNRYYLQCIMKDMGYNIIECSKVASDGFKLKKIISNDNGREIIKKYFNDDYIDNKTSNTIERKLNIMNIKTSDVIDDVIKDIIMNDHKFTDYLHLRKFVRNEMNDKIIDNYLEDFNETAADSIYIKLRYYKQLINYLGIPKGLEYNYDNDKARFAEKVGDRKILDVIDDIKKCFRISGKKYSDFNKEGGYSKLYKMAVGICKHLFGNDILICKLSSIKNDNQKFSVRKYFLNTKFFDCIQKFF